MPYCETVAISMKKLRDLGFSNKDLKSVRKLVTMPTEELIIFDDKKIDRSNEIDIDALPTYGNMIWDKYVGVLPLRFRGNRKVVNQPIKRINVDFDNNMEITIQTDRGQYSFATGQDRSKDFKSGNFVVVDGLGELTRGFVSEAHEESLIDEHIKFGSEDSNSMFKDVNLKDVHGDTAAMVDLLKNLEDASGTKSSKGHILFLQQLINRLDSRFFTEMKTFVDLEADKTEGRIVLEDGTTVAKGDKINININKSKGSAANAQSGGVVYAHEVIHSYVAFALDQSTDLAERVKRELNHLREVTVKKLNEKYDGEPWKVFMTEGSIDLKLEEEIAKKTWDYVFNNSDAKSLHEFVAHALTNEALVKELRDMEIVEKKEVNTIFDKITNWIGKLLDLLSGKLKKKNTKVLGEVEALVQRLGTINNEAYLKIEENKSATDKFVELLNESEFKMSNKMKDTLAKLENSWKEDYTPMPRNGTKLQYAMWLTKMLPRLMTDPQMRPLLGHVLKMLGLGYRGFAQDLIREFRTPDALKVDIDLLSRMSGKVDQIRNAMISTIKEAVMAGFGGTLTETDDEALTIALLDTDMQSIMDMYTIEEIGKLLEDETKLEKAINKSRNKLKKINSEWYNWNATQATGLGYFMATGKGHEAQNMNAYNIANGVLSGELKNSIDGEIEAINELATLYSLKHTDLLSKKRVAKLIKNSEVGVKNVIAEHANFVKRSKEELFEGSEALMIKGYTKNIFNDSIALEVAPLVDEVKMCQAGYELVKELAEDEDAGLNGMGLYRSKSFNRQEYYKAATKLTSTNSRGTSMMQIAMKQGKAIDINRAKIAVKRTDIRRKKYVKQMKAGTFDPTKINTGKVPLVNPAGTVVDYRYMINKQDKSDILEQELRASRVLGASLGSIVDKVGTKEHNENVLSLIREDMRKNYVEGDRIGRNTYEYIVIEPKSRDKYVQEVWKMLPSDMKQNILNSKQGHIAVREDMLLDLFGFRHFSLANTWLIKYMPNLIRTAVKLAEEIWISIVAGAKIDILLRLPFVIIGNIINNMMFSILQETSPRKILKMYITQAKNVREYMTVHKELLELYAAKDSGNILNKDIQKIDRLESILKSNPINELMETGVYESVVEDMHEDDVKANNIISKFSQQMFNNSPDVVKTGWNWFTLNNKTSWYKNMELGLRMGDLIGQAVENQKRKVVNDKKLQALKNDLNKQGQLSKGQIAVKMKREKEALDKARIQSISEDFIFYSAPSSATEEYVNRIGLVMFTKFKKRYQRIIAKTAINHPIRSLLMLAFDEFLFEDNLETPYDQAIIQQMWEGRFSQTFQNPGNLLWHNSPIGFRFGVALANQ